MQTEQRAHLTTIVVHYIIAATVFGFYGARVCPMLDSLSAWQTFQYVAVTFGIMLPLRLVTLIKDKQDCFSLRNDLFIFTTSGILLALVFNHSYLFPLDSNLKTVFGMAALGLLAGLDIRWRQQHRNYVSNVESCSSSELAQKQHSIATRLGWAFSGLIVLLTVILGMIVVKDLEWLARNPSAIHDGSGGLSIIKEFFYVAAVLLAYTSTILYQWLAFLRELMRSQQEVLSATSSGDFSKRVPVFYRDEIGHIATLTNHMVEQLIAQKQEVEDTRDVAIVGLSALAESRDNETGAHIVRTQEYVKAMALKLQQHPDFKTQLDDETIELLYKSAPLHDIGKVGIPDAILLKPGKLTDDEFEIMKQHPYIGAQALETAQARGGNNGFLHFAKEIALTHHEKWNGSGYPAGLSGDNIPLSGRLMAIADVYDALISKRVYKPAFSHEKAMGIIEEGRGSHFDPRIVDAMFEIEEQIKAIAAQHKDQETLAA
ncbi:HD domain-containing phosphohydrolase [Thaumasiovibrio subtropicus]|uniref:HD domain-containing phosphohydrolase n=1 Tax=Thaumasiovibrio subtropicus TaxID=1891207 RepID=UPI000B35D4F2|nr:HD domain-containing phosphohydrolase [Thaumasiovibrio subtropicus]